MPSTRSSTRQGSSSPESTRSAGGTKRKADDSSPTTKSKRGRPSKASKEEQKTLEETLAAHENDKPLEDASAAHENNKTNGDVKEDLPRESTEELPKESTEESPKENGHAAADERANAIETEEANGSVKDNEPEKVADEQKETNGNKALGEVNADEQKETNGTNALDQVKADEGDAGTTNKEKDVTSKNETHQEMETAVEEEKAREEAMPSNILEKGVIYFFTRGRVGINDPESVQDLQRSYFVLRPLPDGAKITDGAIQDLKNNRLIALPKKVWPKSGKDRFMVFVEKAQTTNQILKDEFYDGSEYTTKTTGTRHTPDVTPIGEGVYAITSTGSGRTTTHLAYMLTIPQTMGEVQKDVGLAEKGSFVLSTKNPESSGPAYAQLPQSAEFPKEIIEEFSGRGWMPSHPKHLDYANAQVLLIGEDFEKSDNLEAAPKDEKSDEKETPQEELEKLEEEDEHRVERLKGDDSIFADLGLSGKDYPKVMTTW